MSVRRRRRAPRHVHRLRRQRPARRGGHLAVGVGATATVVGSEPERPSNASPIEAPRQPSDDGRRHDDRECAPHGAPSGGRRRVASIVARPRRAAIARLGHRPARIPRPDARSRVLSPIVRSADTCARVGGQRPPRMQDRRPPSSRRPVTPERAGRLRRRNLAWLAVLALCMAAMIIAAVGERAGEQARSSRHVLARRSPAPSPARSVGANVAGLRSRLRRSLPALAHEGFVLHIHEHLDVYVAGRRVTVPAGIGIDVAGSFISPMHTHDETGVIHVESLDPPDVHARVVPRLGCASHAAVSRQLLHGGKETGLGLRRRAPGARSEPRHPARASGDRGRVRHAGDAARADPLGVHVRERALAAAGPAPPFSRQPRPADPATGRCRVGRPSASLEESSNDKEVETCAPSWPRQPPFSRSPRWAQQQHSRLRPRRRP